MWGAAEMRPAPVPFNRLIVDRISTSSNSRASDSTMLYTLIRFAFLASPSSLCNFLVSFSRLCFGSRSPKASVSFSSEWKVLAIASATPPLPSTTTIAEPDLRP